MILTLTSRKGGCGKTVLAMLIVAALAEQGADVALLDADPNGSAYRWATDILRAPPIRPYAEADAEKLAELLPSLAERHAVVVVDTAGFGNQAATVAAAAADLIPPRSRDRPRHSILSGSPRQATSKQRQPASTRPRRVSRR